MSAYSSQTVTQLKELLKTRGLSTAGVKADLVARLEETDKINDEFDEDLDDNVEETKNEESSAPAADAVAEAEPTVAETTAESSEAPASETTEEATEPVEEKKTLSPEELKAAAIELLNTKKARSEKFGNDEEVKKFEADIRRIEKFGITLESPLAKALGFEAPKKHFKHVHRHHNNHGKRNGFKPRYNNKKHFNKK